MAPRSDAGSERSGVSGVSETSSAAAAKDRLIKRHVKGNDANEEDLLEQSKTLQEAVFTAMYSLAKSRGVDSWRLVVIKLVLEALIPFLVAFNVTLKWPIQTGNPVWQVVRWALPRGPIARIYGYHTYINVFYVLVAVVYVVVVAVAGLTWAMRKQEQSKGLKRFAIFLQKFTDALFSMLYVCAFDYIVFLFSCNFQMPGYPHTYWKDVQCFSGGHVVHLVVAGITAVVFFLMTALMLVASCDLSPIARGIMASPAAVLRLRVLVLKASYVIAANLLVAQHKQQTVIMLAAVLFICYYNFISLPFLRLYINDLWVGGWTAVTYTCVVRMVWQFDKHHEDPDVAEWYMMMVLYGIFPAALLGMAATALWSRHRLRPAPKFRGLDPTVGVVKLRRMHKFGVPDEVEVLARTMRHFDTDGVVLEESAWLGESIIKCGMAMFPGNVGLAILNANFLMEVRKDGPAARTQLQLASKAGPSLVQRYQIFCTVESSKRLKDGQEGQLDLQSYVEFKRNYRAVVRVHKAALAAQREFWQLMQKTNVQSSAIEASLQSMDEEADTAHQVYKRVLERYPANGKLLRCYGKFLEDVRNDVAAASRAYIEASRNGGGDGLLSLDLKINGTDKPEFLTSMDLHEDACIVINAEGLILMVNTCVTSLLGYLRAELEGANVNMIMPQPFSGRHASYLTRYAQGGKPHILDSVRDVVALHKERFVFPLQLCVTKLSGLGADAIFLGVLRPAPLDARNVRAWVAPNGVILCTDPQFASLTGMTGEEMVGHGFQTLVTDMAACESLLEACKEALYEDLVGGTIVRQVEMAHKFLAPVPVEIKVTPGGTDTERIFVLNAHRTDGNTDGLIVTNSKGALTFATWDVAAMLGYPLKKFLKMKLDQLMPAPFATMHAKHLRDQSATVPPTSCRAGRLVQLLNTYGAQVPVRLKLSARDDETGHTQHVVQVAKVDTSSAKSLYADRRLVLTCTMEGKVVSVDNPDSNVFGFTASAAVGTNLADCIDVFGEWRDKAGAHQMELLLLSLLDKEGEMPGTSWRVKVHSPETEDMLPNIDPKAPPRQVAGRIACLQSEIVETGEHDNFHDSRLAGEAVDLEELMAGPPGVDTNDGGSQEGRSLARITLWRRDLLTGVVELDDKLIIRKADMDTGLIVGLPPSALVRMPLSRLLEVPKGVTWDELMKDEKKKSALKGSAGVAVVSAPQAFVGPHPDCGTMRIIVQGVTSCVSGRISATFHPDTTFVGARANVYRALGLETLMNKQQAQLAQHGEDGHHNDHHNDHPVDDLHVRVGSGTGSGQEPHAYQPDADRQLRPAISKKCIVVGGSTGEGGSPSSGGTDGGEGVTGREGADNEGLSSHSKADSVQVSDGVAGEGEGEGEKEQADSENAEVDGAKMYKTAKSQNDFVAQWVRTLSKQMTGVVNGGISAQPSRRGTLTSNPNSMKENGKAPSRSGTDTQLHTGGDQGGGGIDTIAEEEGEGDEDTPNGGSDGGKSVESKMRTGISESLAAGGDEPGGQDGASSQGDDDDANSQGQGQAFSDVTSQVDADMGTDARRGRLLKRMTRLLSGPSLAMPLARLFNHTLVLLLGMLVTHVVCYVVLISLINSQFDNVYEMHRLALAADRCQVAVVKATIIDFCARPGIAAESVCEVGLNATVVDLRAALNDLETYHQGVYLGIKQIPHAMNEPSMLEMWTRPVIPYQFLLDSMPPRWANMTSGLWQVGNRFIAAGRELLYWAEREGGHVLSMRAYQFMLANGPWSLFEGYTVSLEYLSKKTWDDVKVLERGLLILLVVEAALVQLACIAYEWWLVRRVELGRRGGMLVGLGLPGPILRVLANKPLVVLEDSDDEDGGEDDGDGAGDGGGGGAISRRSVDGLPGADAGAIVAAAPIAKGRRASIEFADVPPPPDRGGDAELRRNVRQSMDYVPPPPGGMLAPPPGLDDCNPWQQDFAAGGGAGEQSEKTATVGELLGGGHLSGVLIGGRRGATVKADGPGRMTVNGKVLTAGAGSIVRFVAPLLAWEVALVIIGVLSFVWLGSLEAPLASLNMASHVIYRYTRVRMTSLLMVAGATPEERDTWRSVLKMEVANLEDEYDTLMYGGVARTQTDSVFQHPVPASTFESVTFSSNFFKEESCFRWDQSKCYTPDSPYYEVTHHGLDVMLRRIISEMSLMVADDDADAAYNSTRYTTMYRVGVKDLYEGLQSSAQLFVDFMLSRFDSIKLLHTILMVVSMALFVAYAFVVLRPYRAAVEREAIRLAGLLSHVPAEMDVSVFAKQVLRSHLKLVNPAEAKREDSKPRHSTAGGAGGAGSRSMRVRRSSGGGNPALLTNSGEV